MSAVSILHAARDEALGAKIANALTSAGHAAMRVSPDPVMGDLTRDAANDGAAIVVWTNATAKLAQLHEQARDAMARGALIPVAVGGAQPPGEFEGLPPVDLSGWSGSMDDPRWRFVLEEIQLTQSRSALSDDPVWVEVNDADVAEADTNRAVASDDEQTVAAGSLSDDAPEPDGLSGLHPQYSEYGAEDSAQGDVAAGTERPSPAQTAIMLVSALKRSTSRRFSAREVAIGASLGLVAMTAATAFLGPVLLPGSPAENLSEPGAASANVVLKNPALASLPGPATDGGPAAVMESAASDIAMSDVTPPQTHDLAAGGFELPASASSDPRAPDSQSPENEFPDPGLDDPVRLGVLVAATLQAPSLKSSVLPLAILAEPAPVVTDDDQLGSDGLPISDADALNLAAAIAVGADDLDALTEDAQGAQTTPADVLAAPAIDAVPASAVGAGLGAGEASYLGTYFKECVDCPDMAVVPAGVFRMGSVIGETDQDAAERPTRRVEISSAFAIGTREVTYAEWDACVADGGCAHRPSDYGWGRGKRPVVGVSFEDAQRYTAWLSNKTSRNYRLPTEAEWEYAARAGTSGPFSFGEALNAANANFNGQSPYRAQEGAFRGRTMPTGSFAPNAFGLFDMHGNAWEWTSDCWTPNHHGAPSDGSARISGDCSRRVTKGGAWNSSGWRLRSGHRDAKPINLRKSENGFRVARDLS